MGLLGNSGNIRVSSFAKKEFPLVIACIFSEIVNYIQVDAWRCYIWKLYLERAIVHSESSEHFCILELEE
jgi:hypothetical protein